MSTAIRVELDPAGRVRADLRAGELTPRLLDRGPGSIRIALVATVALLLADDDVLVKVEVGPGVHLEVVETSGTVAYDMRGRRASWRVEVTVADNATLVWAGLPFVVSAGADVIRHTALIIAPSARAVMRETLVLGRTGEVGGDLVTSTVVLRPDGRPVLREELDLTRPYRHASAVLADFRCLDQLLLLGARAELQGPAVLQLAESGTIVRCLGHMTHESALTTLSSYFQTEATRRSHQDTTSEHGLPMILPTGCNEIGNGADGALAVRH